MKRLILIIVICFATNICLAQSIEVWVENYPPFGYKDSKTKEIKGIAAEITQAIVEDAGIQVSSFLIAPWGRAYHIATTKPNIMLSAAVARKPKREKLFHWIGPFADRNIYLFKLKSRTDIKLKSVEDAKKYEVGGVIATASGDFLESKGVTVRRVPKYTQNLYKLLKGRIDLADASDYSFAFMCKQEGISFSKFEKALLVDGSIKYYLVLSKNTSSTIIGAIKKSFKKIKKSGRLKIINDKYLQ